MWHQKLVHIVVLTSLVLHAKRDVCNQLEWVHGACNWHTTVTYIACQKNHMPSENSVLGRCNQNTWDVSHVTKITSFAMDTCHWSTKVTCPACHVRRGQPRGAACSNTDTQPCGRTFKGPECEGGGDCWWWWWWWRRWRGGGGVLQRSVSASGVKGWAGSSTSEQLGIQPRWPDSRTAPNQKAPLTKRHY